MAATTMSIRLTRYPFRFGLLVLVATCAHDPSSQPEDGDRGMERPNFVVVLLDDLDTYSVQYMPQTLALVRDRGVSYESAFVNFSLCSPSRASLLRGQYAHNTGIWDNKSATGGYDAFHGLGLESSTLATWLHNGGYRTALFGKYINRYVEVGPVTVPPGWEEWYATFGRITGRRSQYYDYFLNENGQVIQYGSAPEDYSTDVLKTKAVDFIRRAAASKRPFLAYIAPHAPHTPAIPAPRHTSLFSGLTAPRPPSFNEADMSDKPFPFNTLPLLLPDSVALIDSLYRQRIRSLQAVDEAVAALLRALREAGVLEQTYIFVTSDNGFHLGQHRRTSGKGGPYEEDMKVPLFIRGPGIPLGARVYDLVLNADLAPTIAVLAGVPVPSFVDGRSIVPSMSGGTFSRRAIIFDLNPNLPDTVYGFRAIHTRDSIYIENTFGGRELYDLTADPFELENIAAQVPAPVIRAFSSRLRRLRQCAAESCRALEDRR